MTDPEYELAPHARRVAWSRMAGNLRVLPSICIVSGRARDTDAKIFPARLLIPLNVPRDGRD